MKMWRLKLRWAFVALVPLLLGTVAWQSASWRPRRVAEYSFPSAWAGHFSVACESNTQLPLYIAADYIVTDESNGRRTKILAPGIGYYLGVAVSPDGRWLSFSGGHVSYLLRVGEKGRLLKNNFWRSATFSPDSRTLYLRTLTGFVAMDARTLQQKWCWNTFVRHPGFWLEDDREEAFCPGGTKFVRVDDGIVSLYDLRLHTVKTSRLPTFGLDYWAGRTKVSPGGQFAYRLARGADNYAGQLIICVASTLHQSQVWQRVVGPLPFDGTDNHSRASADEPIFSQDETVCAVRTATRWELFETATGKHLRWITLPPGKVDSAIFSSDDSQIYTLTDKGLWQQRAA